MNDSQIMTIGLTTVPTMLIVLVGILINNARLTDLRSYMDARFGDVDTRFRSMDTRLGEFRSHVDARFDDMRDLWRAELHRVEEVLDARLKHLEER